MAKYFNLARLDKIADNANQIKQRRRETDDSDFLNQRTCPHNVNGDTSCCVPYRDEKDGKTYLRCKICGKTKITTNPPETDRLVASAESFEDACDFLKINLYAGDDNDWKAIQTIAKCLNLMDSIVKGYKELKNNNNKKKKHKKNGGDDGYRRAAYKASSISEYYR